MRLVYLVAAALMLVATPALAGGCCGDAYGPDWIIPNGYEFPPPADQVTQVYVVNQGPVLSGPGLYTYTNPWVPSLVPPGCPDRDVCDAPYHYYAAFPYVRGYRHRWCPGCAGYAAYEPPMYWRMYRPTRWHSRHHVRRSW